MVLGAEVYCKLKRFLSLCHVRDLKMPFSKWSTEQVCDWFEEIGLQQYGLVVRHWVSSGQTLVSATPQDLEKVTHLYIAIYYLK